MRSVRGGPGALPRRLATTLVLSALALFALVQTGGAQPGAEERARLQERVVSYWQAEKEKDYVSSYLVFDPAVRATLSLPAFVRGKRYLTVQGFSVEGIEIKGDSASVRIAYRFEIELPPPPPGMVQVTKGPVVKDGVLDERWVRLGGTWFRTTAGQGQPGR